LIGLGAVLLILTMIINIGARLLVRKMVKVPAGSKKK
jgi:ABC-type phosphate transport system permease subunit